MNQSINQSKSVIIAGNGTSLKSIDYSLLPKDYDVFRCNQFYFEDHYFLGKKIKKVFFNYSVIFEQYYTFLQLIKNNEYEYADIILSSFLNLGHSELKKIQSLLPQIDLGHNYLKKLRAFDTHLQYHELYEDKRITSGVYMCAVATAMGYKDLYLTGIDFYQEKGNPYAFHHQKENIIKLLPSFSQSKSQSNIHSMEYDLSALHFLQKHYGINIYCISPESPLCNYFPLSLLNNPITFLPEEKKNYTQDILIPPESVYKKIGIYSKPRIYQNLIFRLIWDILRLPNDIKHALKAKKMRLRK
ncbi:alpha-2,3-sialyltransferase [Haemophilus influenzae]|uniref:alpha-2,3-sialyltransferase n=1 Tax=Haemophilus influenzae TaxID=727 RepID=UPI00358FBAEA